MRNRQSDGMRQAFQVFLISPLSQTRVPLLDNLTTIVSGLLFPPTSASASSLRLLHPTQKDAERERTTLNLVYIQVKIGIIIMNLPQLFIKGPQMTAGTKSVDISAAPPPVF